MSKFDKIKNKLMAYLVYIQLMMSLVPKDKGGIKITEGKIYLTEIYDFLNKSNRNEIIKKGPILISLLGKIVEKYKKLCPPKIAIEEIALCFDEMYRKNKDIYSWGLDYGWIQSVMDFKKIGFFEDLPFHKKIGIGYHAGFAGVEEFYLLSDAFFMLVLAEESHKNMHNFAAKMEANYEKNQSKEVYKFLSLSNQNVATYSRISILSFFAFVEAFVNSIGFDASLKRRDKISPEELELLHGKKKGKFISLEYKMEKFPPIIRIDKKMPIILSDSKQRREPFITFFKQIKEIRDASVHFSPRKEAIWRKPDDWLEKANSTSKISLEVALEFWKACYPNSDGPLYLNKLNYEKNLNEARKRVEIKNSLIN